MKREVVGLELPEYLVKVPPLVSTLPAIDNFVPGGHLLGVVIYLIQVHLFVFLLLVPVNRVTAFRSQQFTDEEFGRDFLW
jgi:hypothetical protein